MWGIQILTGGLSAALALMSCQGQGIDLDRLLQLHSEARGGRKALEAVNSLQVTLHLVEPGFEADLFYHAMRPRFARVDVTVDGRLVFTEAVNDSEAWQQAGSERAPERSSPEGTAALRRGAIGNLYGLHEMDSDFRTVDGIVRSFRSEDQDLDTGEHLGKTAITHVELNPPLDASFFAMPRKGDCR